MIARESSPEDALNADTIPNGAEGEGGLRALEGTSNTGITVRENPRIVWLYGVVVAALYAPILWETAHAWFTFDNYAHGVFIIPVSLFAIWLQKERLQTAERRPTAWGLLPLGVGLTLQAFGYLFAINFVAMASVIPVLAGCLLILYGPEVWRAARFGVYFLVFAVPFPAVFLNPISNAIQAASSTGAVAITKLLGFTVLQNGNLIDIPGCRLEVADACSGFKKLTALIAFSFLYGYVCRAGLARRAILVAAAIPIALVANIVRIAALIVVTSFGGVKALEFVHNGAEMFVLVVAFGLFLGLDRGIEWVTRKRSPSSDWS